MSLGFLIERDQPAIWRGPIVMKIITQFLRDVHWGTARLFPRRHAAGHRRRAALARAGDARARCDHRDHAAGSRRRAMRSAARRCSSASNVPVLGIVENMSYFAVRALREADATVRQRWRQARSRMSSTCRCLEKYPSFPPCSQAGTQVSRLLLGRQTLLRRRRLSTLPQSWAGWWPRRPPHSSSGGCATTRESRRRTPSRRRRASPRTPAFEGLPRVLGTM